MSVSRPFRLTVREFSDGKYADGGRARYITHFDYSNKPSSYTRPFLLLQKDLLELFNYIEPGEGNLTAFSFRIQEMLVRTCIEIESNFKAIISLNKYKKKISSLTMKDYFLVDKSHFLSDYSAKYPYWVGNLMTADRKPFASWKSPIDPKSPWSLSWYKAYNTTKHDRANSLHLATFENLLDAFAALTILLSAQYLEEDFSPAPAVLELDSGWNDGFDSAIGKYMRVSMPRHLPDADRYDFDWESLSRDPNPINEYDYDAEAAARDASLKSAQ